MRDRDEGVAGELYRAWREQNPNAPEILAEKERQAKRAAALKALDRDGKGNIIADAEGDFTPAEDTGKWALFNASGEQVSAGMSKAEAETLSAHAASRGCKRIVLKIDAK